jgi:tetratricopeptide (TPR) repeat protein
LYAETADRVQVVAKVIDIMVAAGVTSVGLMTPGSEMSANADCLCPKRADVNSKQGWISMNEALPKITPRVAAIAALLILVGGVSGCNKLKARDLLNKGVNAFKNGQSDAAIEDFKEAKAADPELLNARLYLATAYASLYIPGAPSKENLTRGQQAVQEFKEVLDKDPANISAIDGTGSILFQMAGQPFDPKKFEESKTFHQRHIQLKPDDPEPYYWIGVIDWTLAFRANGEMRMDYNKNNIKKQVRDDAPLPPGVRTEYVNKYGALVDEGIGDLQKAISLRPDYDDAMAYLNLLYRRKADMVGTVDERNALLKQADDLVDKVKEIKQKRAEMPQQTS